MNDNVKKKLDRILTVFMIICIVTCLFLCVQVIQGKDASLFGFRIFRILTGSMEPTIAANSNVLVKTIDPAKLSEGDIITFISRDAAIYGNANTHRIYAIGTDEAGKTCFITKGDANSTIDSALVYPEDVIGKVVFHMSSSVSLFLGFLHTKLGFVLVIVLPLMFIIWLLLKDFKKGVDEYIQSSNMVTAAELQNEINSISEEKPEESCKKKQDEQMTDEIKSDEEKSAYNKNTAGEDNIEEKAQEADEIQDKD